MSEGLPRLVAVSWEDDPEVRWVHRTAAVPGHSADWPRWLPEAATSRFERAGIARPWRHQVEAAEELYGGRHVALATGTASGKSLAYLMPILAAAETPVARQPTLVDEGGASGRASAVLSALAEARIARRPGALYLAPTKALAHDQWRVCSELGPDDWRVTTLDGDSSDEERRFARDFATYVLTNPDMLHHSVLPQHQRWRSLLASLRFVVIDEAHRYRGVFGAHVSAVLRRLRRLCHAYGADPVFCCASATAGNAVAVTSLLTGVGVEEVTAVTADASPRGPRTLVVREPADAPDDEAATLLAGMVDAGQQTLAFVSSRKGAELVAVRAQQRLGTDRTIAAYRGGYLARDRRDLERDLHSGALSGIAATNALELGVDVSGMDAVVIAGLPGTTASLWQQAGRAGRRGGEATVVVVPRMSPLDVHLTATPDRLLSAPVEAVVLHPENPEILGPHLVAAAQESPLTSSDERWFGAGMVSTAEAQVAAGRLRLRASGWFSAVEHRAVNDVDLRSSGGGAYEVVEGTTGRILGTCDAGSAHALVHPGAVYLHQGETWVVDRLDSEQRQAWVHAERTGFHTQARTDHEARLVSCHESKPLEGSTMVISHGRVDITSRVYAYLMRDDYTGRVLAQRPLDLPGSLLATEGVWLTFPEAASGERLDAGLHAAEHVLVALLGAFAPADRWDVAARSWLTHPDAGAPTILLWDRHAGGAGFSRAGFARAAEWIAAAVDRLTACGCNAGCPRCCLAGDCDSPERSLDPRSASLLLAGRARV